jgi:hypothetical protein
LRESGGGLGLRRVATTREELLKALDDLRELLQRQGEDFWADWIDGDVEKIKRDDAEGVRHFLEALGGMGSLNDIYFHPMNGNAESEEEGWALTLRFRELKERAFHLANELPKAL